MLGRLTRKFGIFLALAGSSLSVSTVATAGPGNLGSELLMCKGLGQTPMGLKQAQLLGEKCMTYSNHYCYGLSEMGKYYKEYSHMDASEKRDQLTLALNHFSYLESQTGGTCAHQPMVWLSQGSVLVLLNKPAEAAQIFEKAVRRNPKYVPAYLALADLYKKSGQRDVALKILSHGTMVNPTNVALKRRIAEISGKAAPVADEKPAAPGKAH